MLILPLESFLEKTKEGKMTRGPMSTEHYRKLRTGERTKRLENNIKKMLTEFMGKNTCLITDIEFRWIHKNHENILTPEDFKIDINIEPKEM